MGVGVVGDQQAEQLLERCLAKQRFAEFYAHGSLTANGKTRTLHYAFMDVFMDVGPRRECAARAIGGDWDFLLIKPHEFGWGYDTLGIKGERKKHRPVDEQTPVFDTEMRYWDLVPLDVRAEAVDVTKAPQQPPDGSTRLELKWDKKKPSPRRIQSALLDIAPDELPHRVQQFRGPNTWRILRFDEWHSPDGRSFTPCRVRYWGSTTDDGPPTAEFGTEKGTIRVTVRKDIFDRDKETFDW